MDITHNKIRYRRKSPDNSKAGAKAYEAHLRRSLAEGVSLVRSELQIKQAQPFHEFARFWFTTYVVVHNKPAGVYRKKSVLNTKLIPFFGKTPLNQISTLQVELYKAEKVKEGYGNESINGHHKILGKCLRSAEDWLGMEKLPKIKMLTVPPLEHDFFTEEECRKLLAQMNGLWHDIVLTALKTGMRVGELQALRWKDVQLENRTLVVRYSLCHITRQLVAPKSNKTRVVPLTDDIYEMLSQAEAKTTFVFATDKGHCFNGKTLNSEIGRACKRAGLRKMTSHHMRHTYASHLALAGAPLMIVQRLLGHSSIHITMRYAHLTKSSLRETVDLLEKPYQSVEGNRKARERGEDTQGKEANPIAQ